MATEFFAQAESGFLRKLMNDGPSLRARLFTPLLERQMAQRMGTTLSVPQMRREIDFWGGLTGLVGGTQVIREEIEGPGGTIPAAWLVPPAPHPHRFIIYLHGGGYVAGSLRSYQGFVSHIASAAGAAVLFPEYRLAPENCFPAPLEDALATYHWLLGRGVRPGQVVIAGDSAGGGLTLALLQTLRDAGEAMPAAAMVLSPWTDLTCCGVSMRTRADRDPWLRPDLVEAAAGIYCGSVPATDVRVSPLYGDMGGLPPLLIQVGEREILLSDATRLAERAAAANVPVTLEVWAGMWHVWQAFLVSGVPECGDAIDRLGSYAARRLDRR